MYEIKKAGKKLPRKIEANPSKKKAKKNFYKKSNNQLEKLFTSVFF
ncbi:hypothetical protein NEOC65_000874 [Neochlamydia sp. AcF65]|nr:hypothetical protein [Neochlamydia sp. AcF65]